jgi:MFS family permease
MTIEYRSASPQAGTAAAAVLVGTLVSIYIVSQFLRNSVGVIAPDLAAELALTPADLGLLSSVFFFSFAAAQIPVGMALDRYGPRRCLIVCAGITIAGIGVFATASSTLGLVAGRALSGLGAASFLVAPLAIYAKRFSPERFATLTGLQVGIGTIGTLIATAPLAFSATAIGWRASFLVVGAVTVAIGLLLAVVVKDDDGGMRAHRETLRESLAGILAVIRTPSVGRLFVMNLVGYSSFALMVGLWGGPYLAHVYGYDLEARGAFLLIPVLAQIVGSMAWGPMDRLFGGYKVPVLLGSGLTAAALGLLALFGRLAPAGLAVWFAAFGFFGAYGVVLIAHGRALFPLHLVGRGLTLLNIGSMGGTFLAQAISGFVIGLFPPAPDGGYVLDAYRLVFGLQACFMLLAWLAYFGTRDPARRPGRVADSPAPSA